MPTLQEVYLGLGGNLGCVTETLRRGCDLIRAIPGVHDVFCAPYYLTSPVSALPPPFVNTVCRCTTSLNPWAFAAALQDVEQCLGKVKIAKNGPRAIDIDVLLFGSIVVDDPDLQIPHPRWLERLFVLRPMADLVSKVTVPGRGKVDVRKLVEQWPQDSIQWVCAVEDLPIFPKEDHSALFDFSRSFRPAAGRSSAASVSSAIASAIPSSPAATSEAPRLAEILPGKVNKADDSIFLLGVS